MFEIIDSLVTQLEYTADTKVLDKADKKLKELEKQSKMTARAADTLTDEQEQLAAALQKTADKELKLRAEQRRLNKEIKAAKRPSDAQRKALAQVNDQLEQNSISARRLRNDMKALSVQQAKLGRQQRGQQGQMRELGGARRAAGQRLAAADAAKGPGGLAGLAAAATPVTAALAGVTAAGVAAASAVSTVVQTGAEMETLRARLKTVEGSVDGATEAFTLLRGIAKETPFELQDVTNAYVRLKSLGIQPTEQSLKAFGNVAAAQGKPIIDFIEAVADASTGEFERLKEFGIKASSQGEQVAFTFGGVTTRVGKNAAEITKFLEGLGQTKFAGAMEDQMNTFNGVLSNLKDGWTNFLDQIAQMGVLDEAKLLLKELSGTMGDELVPIIADMLIDLLRWLRETMVSVRDSGGGLKGTLEALANIVDVLAVAVSPLIAIWEAMVATFNVAIQVAGTVWGWINKLIEAIGRLVEPLTQAASEVEIFGQAWAKVQEIGSGIAGAIDKVTGSLFSQAEAIAVVKGSLEDLREQIGKDVTELTDEQLQTLRRAGGEAGAQAEIEINRRIKEREALDEAEDISDLSLEELRRREKKKLEQEKFNQKKAGRAEEIAKDFSVLNDRQLAAYAADPNVPKELRDKAEKEQLKRSKKRKKKGAAAATKMRDATLIADVEKQIEKNARKLAQAEAARGLRSRELTAATAGEFETRRFKEIRDKQLAQFRDTGKLPAGIAQDVRQIAALPSINDLAGRQAPPVISNTINKFEISGNEFNAVVEGGTFEGTPQGFARATLVEQRRGLNQLLGESVPSFSTNEVR